MKGDFTRLTFRPEKHYTSVRMQQGRLQLDSDWNEQADIQTHLYHTQAVDFIGSESGVPTSQGDTDKPNRDSFKISVISPTLSPQEPVNDLAITPGHIYVNGTLCELESSLFSFKPVSDQSNSGSNRVNVSSLIIDGRKLEPGQWVELYADNPELSARKITKIKELDSQKLELTLSETVTQTDGKMRRLVTYQTQPDYPNADAIEDGFYLAYLDVWQRHITAIEDSSIREIALNVPDTTTRTKTVWQLKLQKLSEQFFKDITASVQEQKDLLQKFNQLFPQGATSGGETNPNDSSAIIRDAFIKEVWGKYLIKRQGRSAYMNACAALCPATGGSANSTGYQRLENQLYRVEIHDSGQGSKATFKWSRDNGSIVSAIEKIQGNTITIRKSSQDAWTASKTGQWIEITDEEMELKGKPGVLVPLVRASDTKIEFNQSRIVNGPIPSQPTKVRRWDHTTQEAAILTRSDWIELESGVKVKFEQDSIYATGDYWLIPARAATNDIEWPNDQAAEKRQPLAQLPLGIQHNYCLLALVNDANPPYAKDYRVVFPPLSRCLDTAGGVITGTLEIQSDLYITGNTGIGILQASEKLEVNGKIKGSSFIADAGVFQSNKDTLFLQINTTPQVAIFKTGNVSIGDNTDQGVKLFVAGEMRGSHLTGGSFKISADSKTADISPNKDWLQFNTNLNGYSFDKDIQVNGNIGIGVPQAVEKLEVDGKIKAKDLEINGKVGIGATLAPDATLNIQGKAKADLFEGDGSNLSGVVKTAGDNTLIGKLIVQKDLIVNGNASLGATNLNSKLTINGNAAIGEKYAQSTPQIAPPPQNGLLVEGHVGIGVFEPKGSQSQVELTAKLEIQGASRDSQDAALNVTDSNHTSLLYVRNDGNIGIGKTTPDAKLDIAGSLTASGELKGQQLTTQSGVIRSENNQDLLLQTGDTVHIQVLHEKAIVGIGGGTAPDGAKLYVNGNLYTANQIYAKDVTTETSTSQSVFSREVRSNSFTQISSIAFKEKISDLSYQEALEIVKTLNPIKFTYLADEAKAIHAGFLVEDFPDLLTSSDKQAIKILDVVAVLTKTVQHSQETIAELTKVVNDQQNDIATLQGKIQELEAQNLASHHHDTIAALRERMRELEERTLGNTQHSEWFPQTLTSSRSRNDTRSRRQGLLFYRILKRLFRRLLNGNRRSI